MTAYQLHHHQTTRLVHHGLAAIMGVAHDDTTFVEEYYADEYLSHVQISADGRILQHHDEDAGQREFVPLALPSALSAPQRPLVHPLDSGGGRVRGLRAEDRVSDWASPLSIAEKLALLAYARLQRSPMQVLGLGEQRTLARAPLPAGTALLVRRIGLLLALPAPLRDAEQQAYDYDTHWLYIAHAEDDADYAERLRLTWDGVDLHRPMDVLGVRGKLYIAEGGDSTTPSQLHVWKITQSPYNEGQDMEA